MYRFIQDNTRNHTCYVAMAAIHHSVFQFLEHSPYLPDLTSYDYRVVPENKKNICIKELFKCIKQAITAFLVF